MPVMVVEQHKVVFAVKQNLELSSRLLAEGFHQLRYTILSLGKRGPERPWARRDDETYMFLTESATRTASTISGTAQLRRNVV
jgi:hypothetical protein